MSSEAPNMDRISPNWREALTPRITPEEYAAWQREVGLVKVTYTEEEEAEK